MSLAVLGFVLVHGVVAQSADVGEPPPKPRVVAPDARPAAASNPRGDALDPMLIAGLQLGTACATYVVGVPLLSIGAYGCPVLACGLCLTPAAAGYLATLVGDRLGGTRAPAIFPILAAYAGVAVAGAGAVVLYLAALGAGSDYLVLGGAAVGILGLALSILGVPAAYALSAVDKAPGDDGGSLPGIFQPAHPESPVDAKPRTPGPPPPPPTPKAPSLPALPTPPPLEPAGLLHAMRF
jgi:hypothetical protein